MPIGGPVDGVPKAKAKTKATAKKKSENPKAVFDVRKAKPSSLRSAFPIVDRPATKELLNSVMLQKAGLDSCRLIRCTHACICHALAI